MIAKNEIKFKIGDVVWFWKDEEMMKGPETWSLCCSSVEYFIVQRMDKKYVEYSVKGFAGHFTNGCHIDDNLYPSFEYAMASDPR